MLYVLQYQCKIRSHLIIVKLQSFAVISQKIRKHQRDPADAAGIGVCIVFVAFSHGVVKNGFHPFIIICIEQKIVGRVVSLKRVPEKMSQKVILGEYGIKTAIKGAFPDHDTENGGVIVVDLKVMHGIGSNNTELSVF